MVCLLSDINTSVYNTYYTCGVMGPNYTIGSWVLAESMSSSRMTEW